MKHLKLAITMILLSVQPVWAESFPFMGEANDRKFYIDSDNIKKNGNFRMVLIIMNRPSKGADGQLSHVSRYEYDCYEEKRRERSWAEYSEPFGKGEMTRSRDNVGTSLGQWFRVGKGPNDPDPVTIISTKIMNIICAK